MFTTQPVALTAAVSVAIKAILLATMAFGLPVTAPQLAEVMFAVDSLLALYAILVVRNQVTPNQQVDKLITTATHQNPGTDPEMVKEIQAVKDKA